MAAWALGLACIPLLVTLIIGFVLAIIVVTRPKDGYNRGRGMAIAALVIAPLWVAALTTFIVVGLLTGSSSTSTSTGSTSGSLEGDVASTSIRVGDCLAEDIDGLTRTTVKLASCSKPHASEAYANFDLPRGDYPGDSKVDKLSQAGCTERFEEFVGADYDSSELDLLYLYPTEDSWDSDRAVTCLVADGSSTTGSLKGANR
jgi:hypothetical protein